MFDKQLYLPSEILMLLYGHYKIKLFLEKFATATKERNLEKTRLAKTQLTQIKQLYANANDANSIGYADYSNSTAEGLLKVICAELNLLIANKFDRAYEIEVDAGGDDGDILLDDIDKLQATLLKLQQFDQTYP